MSPRPKRIIKLEESILGRCLTTQPIYPLSPALIVLAGKSADPGSDPSNNSAPAGNKPLGAAPHKQNPPANDPAPNQSIPDPSTGNNPPAFQFGSGQGSPDPNNMSPAQLSALHQALQPSQAPAAADPASDPGSNPVGNNVGGSSTGSGPDPQPNESPGAPAGASNNQPVDFQLQSISSAIFNNPASGSSGGQQDPASAGSGSGRSGSGDSPMNALVNVPQAKDSPQGNDAPQIHDLPMQVKALLLEPPISLHSSELPTGTSLSEAARSCQVKQRPLTAIKSPSAALTSPSTAIHMLLQLLHRLRQLPSLWVG